MQEVGSFGVDPKALTGRDQPNQKKQHGELVVGIRLDEVPTGEAKRLAGEGKFYPLTMDANGFLRVTLPEGAKVETDELQVMREMALLLEEIRDALLKIA